MQLCPRYGFYIVNYGHTKDSYQITEQSIIYAGPMVTDGETRQRRRLRMALAIPCKTGDINSLNWPLAEVAALKSKTTVS